eukprot:728697-Pyramimonas_sp.AAC.1
MGIDDELCLCFSPADTGGLDPRGAAANGYFRSCDKVGSGSWSGSLRRLLLPVLPVSGVASQARCFIGTLDASWGRKSCALVAFSGPNSGSVLSAGSSRSGTGFVAPAAIRLAASCHDSAR